MKIPFIIILFFILSCNSKNSSECDFYQDGIAYYSKHFHGDYADKGCYDTTIIYFQKALNAGCHEYNLFERLSYCYNEQGDFTNAEKYISKAIALNRNKDIELFYSRGQLNGKLQRLKQAELDFNTYLESSNALHQKDGYYWLGVVQYLLGDSAASQKSMSKAVMLNGGKEMREFKDFAEAWGITK